MDVVQFSSKPQHDMAMSGPHHNLATIEGRAANINWIGNWVGKETS
jgi:hypothetical protein